MDISRCMSKGKKYTQSNRISIKKIKTLDFLFKRFIMKVGKKVDDRL